MAEEIAVSVRDLTKKYRLFSTPMERLKESLHPLRKRYHKEFWALKGISFDVPKGQVLGILGRNGSGKSTLLQIIASVLQPTAGTVTVNGRVAALLELGAGFNPEFTGRQNVLLNGAIMGVPHDEMLARIPAIIDFADIGEFFDQPMKIYSSGMFVRVAFAAAIHVDPEILIIDEALAVGDAKFQHKCFQFLAELRQRGKTILFVTHSTSLVTSHCGRAILLDGGQLITAGDPARVVDRYYDLLFESTNGAPSASDKPSIAGCVSAEEARQGLADILDISRTTDTCYARRSYNKNEVRFGNGAARIIDYVIESDNSWDVNTIVFGSEVSLYIKVLFYQDVRAPVPGFTVKTIEGIKLSAAHTSMMQKKVEPVVRGQVAVYKYSFSLNVNPGDYFFDIGIAEEDGTRGGTALDVRMSVAHTVVSLEGTRPFDGLINLAPNFQNLTAEAKL